MINIRTKILLWCVHEIHLLQGDIRPRFIFFCSQFDDEIVNSFAVNNKTVLAIEMTFEMMKKTAFVRT